jgi:hypothetical protein
MKPLKLTILSITLLTLLGCGKDPSPQASEHDKLVKKIRQALPRSWDLAESAGQILVFRKEPIRSHGCVGLDLGWVRHTELLRKDVEENGVTQDFKIRLLLRPKLDSAEYARIKAVNDQINVTKSTMIQGREFYEYDAMRSFDPRYRELPQYFTTDSSIYLQTTLDPWACIYPPEVARECEQVLQTLDTFFTRYPDAKSRTRWSWMAL